MAKKHVALPALCEGPSIAKDIARLRDLSMAELLDEYQRAFGKPPRVKHRAYLWKRIAWKLEEVRTGGLSMVAKARLEELIAQLGIDFSDRSATGVPKDVSQPELLPGTSITRDYKGKRLAVHILEEGFEFKGETFKSLSGVAKAATGQHMNGRAFFGLTKKGVKK